jgi:hypothetical protein
MFGHNDQLSKVGVVKILLVTRALEFHEALDPLETAMAHNPVPEE